jgi:hypothetical protein
LNARSNNGQATSTAAPKSSAAPAQPLKKREGVLAK